MLIQLATLKEGTPVQVHTEYDPKKLELESVDMRYSKPLDLEGTVEKGFDSLSFRGHVATEVERICGRCLKSVRHPLDEDFEFYYETKGQDAVETTNDIREIFILDHPMAYICQEKCRGLCPQCGTNLNEMKCDCAKQNQGSKLSTLKEFWNQKSQKENHGAS